MDFKQKIDRKKFIKVGFSILGLAFMSLTVDKIFNFNFKSENTYGSSKYGKKD